MAGINSRPKFDTCDIDNILAITMNAGKYTLSEDQVSQNPYCISNVQPIGTRVGRVSALDQKNSGALVDIESHLHNIDTPLSNCSLNRTMADKQRKGEELSSGIDGGLCPAEHIQTIYSKLDIPSNTFRSATSHRFDFPIIHPAEFVFYGINGTEQVLNNRDGVNTRLQAKDRFRML